MIGESEAKKASIEQIDRIRDIIKTGKVMMEESAISRLTYEKAADIISRFDESAHKPETKKNEPKATEHDEEYAKQMAVIEFDMMDEEQIVEILEGRSNKKYIYSFPVGGKTIEGISYAGTIDAARYYSENLVSNGFKPLETVDYSLLETDDMFRAFVRVKDGKSGLIIPGYSSQAKKMKVYTNREHTEFVMKVDDKADVKCVSKATRNALRNSMPASYIDAYIVAIKKGMRK